MTMPFGPASDCNRAARLGVSPTTACSWAAPAPIRSPTTTSPVAMPSLTCSRWGRSRRPTASTIAKRGAHRLLGIVLVGMRVAEIGENAVAHVFCDKAAKANQYLRNATMIFGDDLAQILRIEPRCQLSRTDQIAEHDRKEAAFGSRDVGRLRGNRSLLAGIAGEGDLGRRAFLEGLYGREQFAPVPDRGNAEGDKVIRGQLGQDVTVDVIVAECLRVLFESQPLEPIGNARRHH